MAAQAKVIIKAEENISQVAKQAKNSLGNLESMATKFGSTIKGAFKLTAVIASVKKLGDAVSDCFTSFTEANRKYTQLEMALGSGEAYEKVTETIENLSRQTLNSKDSIESMVSELAALGKSSDDIDKISTASVYLSNVTGKSLTESMNQLLGTYQGSTTEIEKLGINVGEFTKLELANGAAIDEVISSLQEYNTELAKTDTSQHLTNISNSWDSIKRSVGDLINYSFSPLITSFDKTLSEFKTKFDGFIQQVKIVFNNFPTVMEQLGSTVSSIMARVFSYDGVKSFLNTLVEVIPKYVKQALKNVISLLDLAVNAIPDTVKSLMDGIYNYGMYLLTSYCDEVGFDLTELINSIGTWLTDSDIGKIIDNVLSTVINGVKLVGALIKNIPDMLTLVLDNADVIVENAFISLKNFFYGTLSDMVTWLGQTLEQINFPQMVENVKTAVQNFFGKIGAWFTAIGETGKDTFRYIGDVLKITFSWDTIKTSVTTLFKNLGTIASSVIKTIFISIPKMISNLFSGIIKWIGYVGVKLKNTILESIENVIQDAGSKIQGTWFGKLFGLGDKLATISLGVDKETESSMLASAKASFSSIGDNFTEAVQDAVDAAETIEENNKVVKDLYSEVKKINVATPDYKEVTAAVKDSGAIVEKLFTWGDALASKKVDNSEAWSEIGDKFDELLSPVIEEWSASTGETLGEKLATWTAKSSEEYLDASKESFSTIGEALKTWGADFILDNKEAVESIWKDVQAYAGDIFGDDISKFTSWLDGFLQEQTEALKDAVDDASDKVVTATKTKSTSSQIFSSAWDSATTSSTTDASGNAVSIFSKESGVANMVSSLASSLGSLLEAVGSIIDAIVSGCWWMAILLPIIEGFCEVFADMVTTVLAPLKDTLKLIGNMIAELFLPIFDSLYPIFEIIANILMTAVVPILQILSPIIELIALVLDALTPVIAGVGKVFTAIMAPVQWVADLFSWLGKWISYLGSCIGTAIYNITHPFSQRSYGSSPGGFSSDAFSGLSERLAKWDEYGTHNSAVTDSVSTQTAVSSASYQGATQVTINIYQEAPVVGEGGMRQFAQMIREQFMELDYYGVTV